MRPDDEPEPAAAGLAAPPSSSGGAPVGLADAPHVAARLLAVHPPGSLLGRRIDLHTTTRFGRGSDSDVVLNDPSASRRHAVLEPRGGQWAVIDERSTTGTHVDGAPVHGTTVLGDTARIRMGRTIFQFWSGVDVEAPYIENVYRMTISDGLTQTYNQRYLLEALERELVRHRRYGRPLALLRCEVRGLDAIARDHGELACDLALVEVARVLGQIVPRDNVSARSSETEFMVIAADAPPRLANDMAVRLQRAVEMHAFRVGDERVELSLAVKVADSSPADVSAEKLLVRTQG